jgi:cytochrome b
MAMTPTLTPDAAAPGAPTTAAAPAASAPASTGTGAASRGRRVTDAPTRVVHALIAFAFAGAWLTGDSEQLRAVHVALGYTLAALLGWRLFDGLFGPRPVRLASLWHRAMGGWAWLRIAARDLLAGRWPAWRQAPGVLMGGVLLATLAVLPLVAASGYATFAEWGGDALEEVHEVLANTALVLVLAHLALLAAVGWVRRQNPALPMLTGRVPGRGPDLVPRQRHALAVLLLVAAVAFGAWQWATLSGAGAAVAAGGDGATRGEHRGKLANDD